MTVLKNETYEQHVASDMEKVAYAKLLLWLVVKRKGKETQPVDNKNVMRAGERCNKMLNLEKLQGYTEIHCSLSGT